ncbi:toxin-antitoxin system YwqK family antitoxin [Thermaurantimonas aggregans]|uniref:toxin-antitoxin system YwqK family antitoxin n=1 Tax=Thermaurantimonas aggregans TaxID=2173829 RepID=UPI000F57434F|nr:toxin-antitoxin system YwqK family antitoxin [Thermaurantimonas aggregans]
MAIFFLHRINNLIIITTKKKNFLFSLLILVNCKLLNGQNNDTLVPVILYYQSGAIASKGFLRNNMPDGFWINYYENGIKKSEGNRINYLLDGTWYFYDSLGNLRSTINYSNGIKHGPSLVFENDQVIDSSFYMNNLLSGMRVLFKNGYKTFIYQYVNGLENDDAYELDTLGTIISVFSYKDGILLKKLPVNRKNNLGLLEGIYMDFYPDYKKKIEGFYKNGKKNGQFKFFSPNGEIIKIEIWINDSLYDNSNNAKVNLLRRYHEGTFLIKQEGLFFEDSIPIGKHSFYDEKGNYIGTKIFSEKGILLSEGMLDSNGRKFGLWKFYYTDGKLYSRGEFYNDLKEGIWEYYYPDGSIQEKGEYKRDLLNGKWLSYCTNGNILKEISYINGKEEGLLREYDCDGNLIKEANYEDGLLNGPWFLSLNNFTEKGQYLNDLKSGKWLTFYDDVTLKSEVYYENGLLNGSYTIYYPDGKKMITGNYLFGKRDGIWSFYDQNGNKYLTIEYKNDVEKKYNGVKITL